jgi:hypothetical protein
MMNVEQSVECELAVETEVLGENLPQFHFVLQKSHMTSPGVEPPHSRGGKTAANRRSYATAYSMGLVWSYLHACVPSRQA